MIGRDSTYGDGNDASGGEIDVARLIADLRQEAARKSNIVSFKMAKKPPSRWPGGQGRARRRQSQARSAGNTVQFNVDLRALMRLDGPEFIRKAYLKLLGRRPDPGGAAFFLARLRGGWADKVGVLQALRYSEEGYARNARIPGLKLAILCRNLFSAPDILLTDLIRYDGAEFILNAYRRVLGREPDSGGYASQLKQLEHGWVGKIRVLANFRSSAEGRARNIRIGGLRFAIVLKNLYLGVISLPRRMGGGLVQRFGRVLGRSGTGAIERGDMADISKESGAN